MSKFALHIRGRVEPQGVLCFHNSNATLPVKSKFASSHIKSVQFTWLTQPILDENIRYDRSHGKHVVLMKDDAHQIPNKSFSGASKFHIPNKPSTQT